LSTTFLFLLISCSVSSQPRDLFYYLLC